MRGTQHQLLLFGGIQAGSDSQLTDIGNWVEQQALVRVILQDPAVDHVASFIGVDGTNVTPNSGRIQITLKPLEERGAQAAD